MHVKKSNGKIIGAAFTADEKKAAEIEIGKQLNDYLHEIEIEINAKILMNLREQLGYGPKRMRRFFDKFQDSYKDLMRHYELTSDDVDESWFCSYMLKRKCGVDVEQWLREADEKEKREKEAIECKKFEEANEKIRSLLRGRELQKSGGIPRSDSIFCSKKC